MQHSWRSDLGDRVHPLNTHGVTRDGARYVLVWTQQTLRSDDNPLLDAAIDIGNALGLPVLVYHGLRQDYPYASDRLHRFILGASRSFLRGCAVRGLKAVAHVDRPGRSERGLIYRLAEEAAVVLTDDHYAFIPRDQAKRVAQRSTRAVWAVDAARLVPTRKLPPGLSTTPEFRKASGALRAEHEGAEFDFSPVMDPYCGPLPFEPDSLDAATDAELDALVAACEVDHTLPAVPDFPASMAEADARLTAFVADSLARYAFTRNNPTERTGASHLSPYLHFGLIGPRKITRAVRAAEVHAKAKWKYLDELLTWREWFHYRALHIPELHRFAALPDRPRQTLLDHAEDPRPTLYSLRDLMHGRTDDDLWNAAQRTWLVTGYMHNNLRMYWGKQIIKWTDTPQTAWAVACYLNDRLALDGRDPATYGNMQWVFGTAKPGWREMPVYGWVAPKSDRALRKRKGVEAWIAHWSGMATPDVALAVGVDDLTIRY